VPDYAEITEEPYVDPTYLSETPGFASAGYWDYYKFDVMSPLPQAELLYESTAEPGSGVSYKFEDEENNGFRKILIYTFDYVSGFSDSEDAQKMLLNGIEYARDPEYGRGKIFGRVTLAESSDHSGVEISNSLYTATSFEDGRFIIHSPSGEVTLGFSAEGYYDTSLTLMVEPNEEIWGVEVELGLESVSENIPEDIQIKGPYPNPANATFRIDYSTNIEEKVRVQIFNISGKEILEKSIKTETGQNRIDIECSNLESGVYFYKISSNVPSQKGKFILLK
jgi:hypothetical protein